MSDHPDAQEIQITITVGTLRLMRDCAVKCYQTWPGGDPEEQIALEKLLLGLNRAVLDCLLDDGRL